MKKITEKQLCIFCNLQHSSNECKNFTSYESGINNVKTKHLFFNCLGNHKVSKCRIILWMSSNKHHNVLTNKSRKKDWHSSPDCSNHSKTHLINDDATFEISILFSFIFSFPVQSTELQNFSDLMNVRQIYTIQRSFWNLIPYVYH